MIEINTDDISFDEPPKQASEPKFKPKPITAPKPIAASVGTNGSTDTKGAGMADKAKEVTGTVIQFNEENILFEFSMDGCRGVIGVVKTQVGVL